MSDLTELEIGVLGLVDRCGGSNVDLSGPRIRSTAKAAARECLRKGLLSGKPSGWSITDAGRSAYLTSHHQEQSK